MKLSPGDSDGAADPPVPSNGQPLRVLLVDDHPLMRLGVRGALQPQFPEAQIEEVSCAAEALAVVFLRRPDLALVAVNLPGMNGLDLARQIRAGHPGIRLLVLAGEVDSWMVDEALKAGISGFITKADSGKTLPEAIRAVMAGRLFLSRDAHAALRRLESGGPDSPVPTRSPVVLSSREREVLLHLARGENTKSIAASLRISPKTVETHRRHLCAKLGTNNVATLTRYAIRQGLTPV